MRAENVVAHRVCPICFVGNKSDLLPDSNIATCICGWSGVVHDLKPVRSTAFNLYRNLLIDLHREMRNGNDSDCDLIRDKMTTYSDLMSEIEIQDANALSAYLYQVH